MNFQNLTIIEMRKHTEEFKNQNPEIKTAEEMLNEMS